MNSILKLIYRNYKKQPNNVAIVDENGSFTWKELFDYAYAIATKLLKNEIKKQDCVSVELPNCKEFIASIIACQIIGAVYVPVGDTYPQERVKFIRKDCDVKAVIDKKFIDNLDLTNNKEVKPVDKNDEDIEMIIYTSGSTGQPKGVVHPVSSILRSALSMHNKYFNLQDNDKMLLMIPIFFIAGIQLILLTITANNFNLRLYLMDIIHIKDTQSVINYINQNKINKGIMSPALWNIIKDHKCSLERVLMGGDIPKNSYKNGVKIFSSYGTTELAGGIFFVQIQKNHNTSILGRPLKGVKPYILDENLKVQDEGELCIASDIAIGYNNLPGETNKHFIDNPFFVNDGYKKIYKTGDIVKTDENGNIIIVGRKDFMVNINGQRVEIQEVEDNLNNIEGIQNSAIRSIQNNDSIFLVAYYVSENNLSQDFIKKELSKNLADYMIPSFYVKLDEMPMLPNGKINRQALPKFDISSSQKKYIAPTNEIERTICNAFSQVFNIEKIGIEDDFMSLGGDSLSAIRMLSILKDKQLQATDITSLKTPKKIAKKIQKSNIVNLDLNKYTLDTGAPLSEQQLNIYLDIKANNKIESYLIPLWVNLDKYDTTQIKNALAKMLDIHPILNSYITIKDNDPWLSIGDNPKLIIVDNIDKYELSQYLSKPFDIDKNLSRYLFNKQNKTLYAVFHHMIFDGMSLTVFKKDLINILEGTQPNYTDTTFLLSSAYSYEIKNTDLYREASTFFEKEFCDSANLTEPIPDIGDNTPSYNLLNLNTNKEKIDSFIKKHKITRGILYTSVFAYMLSRFTNSNKSYFSIIENGRDRHEASASIGMFVNTLPIIIECADTSISSFIDSAQNKIYKTTKYNFYPYRLLANKFNLKNNIDFQYQPNAMLEYSNTQTNENGFLYSEDIKTRTDLISDLSFVATDSTLSVTSSSKYSSVTAKRMLEIYKRILDDLLVKNNLSDINYTIKNDLKLVQQINKTEKELKYSDILEAFKYSIEKYPDKKLVTYEDTSYTYSEGAIVISTIADKLKELDVKTRANVAIFVSRSHWYLLCALGILTTSCAYVPIDDNFPNKRIAFMLNDTSADAVLATNETINRVKQIVKENSIKTKIINVDEIDYSNDRDSYTYTHVNKSDIACILYTSGTTGVPKGTLITRRAILNFSLCYIDYMHMSNKDIYSMYTVSTFDMHVVGYYPILIVGATLNIIPDDLRLNLETLSMHLNKTNTTHITLPTKIAKLLLKINKLNTVNTLLVGGDKLGKIDIQKNMDIFDGYGPTETLAYISSIKARNKNDLSSVGTLSYNTKTYILDKELRLVPYGAQGELYLSGYQLAKGYLNRDKETNTSFIKNPFDGDVQGYVMMYKTGDIVRYLPDKTLGFIGRADSQVKIRGNRVELGEVEACIREISEVKDVTVQTITNNSNKELVAYVVADKHDKSEVNIKNLIKKHVSNTKPDYMIPTHVVVLDKIPLNINGKVDVRALPNPDITKSKIEYVEPTNEIERKICNAFSQVFNIDKIGIEDDFIALGGDSLSAIRMLSILKDYQLQATDITSLKTPKQIAKQIQKNNVLNLDLNKYTLDTGAPLSEQQLNIYLDIKANNKIESYLIPLDINLDKYDITQIKKALIKISDIHPILNSYITIKNNDPWLSIGDTPKLIIVDNIDEYELSQYLSKPFDIDKNLSRYLFNKQNKTLYAVFHHMIFDGMSSAVFKKDLISILDGTQANYTDTTFLLSSAYSYEIKDTDLYRKASTFFEKEFCDSENLTEPIPDIGDNKPSYNVIELNHNKKQIDSFIEKHKITRGILYTSVFAYMLSRFTNSNKSFFSMIENGRDRLEADSSIGMFVNTLPIIIDCTDTSISSFIDGAQNKIYKTTKYNFYPYRLLASKYNLKNNIDFQYQSNAMLEYSNTQTNENDFLYSKDIKTRTDLISDLSFIATDDTVSVISSSKYSFATTKRMLKTYKRILDDLLVKNNLSDINYTINRDLELIQQINKTEKELKYNDILEAFNESLSKYPNNILVSYKDTKYTYAQSSTWIHVLLNKLKDIPKESNIAILVPRSHYYLLTALAVLAHGCAYVPIDDTYPDERVKFMLEDSDAKAIIVTNKTTKRVVDLTDITTINISKISYEGDIKPLKINYKNNDVAVVVYTSGTTGIPKGTLITRGAIINLCESYVAYNKMQSTDIFALYVSFGFDVHIEALFPPILVGAAIDVLSYDLRLNVYKFLEYLSDKSITYTDIPAAFAKNLLSLKIPRKIKSIFIGGESLGDVDCENHICFNVAYGPTESTVSVSAIRATKRIDSSSIGNLFYNNKAYILDKEQRIVPYGAQGELYLSGYQLAKGYLNRDKETNSVFIKNPFDGDTQGYEMMYKTGDIVRYLPDGTLGFIGRADSQVKIRGNRVELGEVESCIREISEIQDITVQTITNNNNKELVAYVVADKHNKSDVNIKDLIKKHVSNTKPDYMIPAHVVVLDKIPLNINGKVDVRALPNPDITKSKTEYVEPTNEIERKICNAFSQVFNIDKIGIEDDFIALGGDSLSAIRMLSILKDYQLQATDITSLKTPKQIAKQIQKNNVLNLDLNKYTLDTGAPLSEQQLNIYLDIKANNKIESYLIPLDINLDKYDITQIKNALAKMSDIHPILKSYITIKDNDPWLSIGDIPKLTIVDNIDESKLKQYLSKPFDIDKNLSRYLFNKQNKTLYAVFHHMIFDGMSSAVFKKDLMNILEGTQPNYKDTTFLLSSAYSYEIKNTDLYRKASTFFEREFCDSENLTEPIHDIGDNKPSYNVIELTHNKKQIDSFIKKHKITRGVLHTSVFAYMLSRFTNSNKSYFSMIENGRDRHEASASIGMFVNTLPIIINCADTSISSFIDSVQNKIYKTTKYNFYPYRLLANKYSIKNNIVFQYQPSVLIGASNKKTDLSGSLPTEDIKTRKDLIAELSFFATDDTVSVTSSSKYSSATTKRMLETYKRVLDDLLAKNNLSDINYTINSDLKLIQDINKTEKELKYNDILEAFNESLSKYPNNILVSYKDIKYTYAQSSTWIHALLDKLKDIPKKSNIAILVPRSHYYLLTALVVLSHGSAYVPIDDAFPDERIKLMLKDSDVSAILVTNKTLTRTRKLTNKQIINISDKDDNITTNNTITPKPLPINSTSNDTAVILYTSGTTGNPKGTLISHFSIAAMSQYYSSLVNMKNNEVYGLYSSFGFDMHTSALYTPVIVGASVNIIPSEILLSMNSLNNYISKYDISHTFMTVKVAKLFLSINKNITLKSLLTGGESIGLFNVNNKSCIYYGYGPTEYLAVTSAIHESMIVDYSTLGNLSFNTKAYILDKELRLVPYGAQGELYLSGYQLSKGYLNRNNETKKSFIKNPFDGDVQGYEMMYKTGDIVRYLPDKTLGFIGRVDKQVKIRGNRVELGEVETCIREVSVIKDVTVQTITNNNNKELVAYVVADKHDKSDVTIKDLIKKHVSNTKPDYMIPAHIVMLDKIPLNINGKVDVRALPKPDITKSKTEYIAPTNDIELSICNAFSQVFNIDKIGIEDDFMSLGGDSLSAIRMLSMLKDYQLQASDITSLKTPKQIAKQIQKNNVLSLDLNKYTLDIGVPLSEQQLNIYLDIKANNKIESYLIPLDINLDKYDITQIKNALIKMSDIHPILNSYITIKDNDPWLSIGDIPKLTIVDNIDESKLNQYLSKPFDIDKKLSRYLLNKQNKTLYAVFHHIIFDGMSSTVFKKDLISILDDTQANYTDTTFLLSSAYSYEIKNTDLYRKASTFFEKEFCDSENLTEPIPDIGDNKPSYNVIELNHNKKQIDSFIEKHKITRGILYTSVFAYMLSRFTNSNKSFFSMIENGRDRLEADSSIGMFVNTLPIIIDCTDTSISSFIDGAQNKIYKTTKYNFYPYRLLASKYNLKNNIDFQYQPNAMLEYSNTQTNENDFLYSEDIKTRTDLISDLSFIATDDTVSVISSSKYSFATTKRMLKTYKRILDDLLVKNNLSDINYTINRDLELIQQINKTEKELKYNDILEAFNESLSKYPNNILVSYKDTKYTYAQSSTWIHALLNKLKDIPKESNIAILVPRSHYYLLTALAVLAHGCAYVPIDDTYPDERVKFMLEDSDAKAVIVTNKTTKRVVDLTDITTINISKISYEGDIKPLKINYKNNDVAVVVYTSGTTGIPKGTLITRGAIINLCESYVAYNKMQSTDIFALYVSFGFDVHIEALFPPILVGAAIDVLSYDLRLNVYKFLEYLSDKSITYTDIPVAFAKNLLSLKIPRKIKSIFIGGESLGDVDCENHICFNVAYGPTESTVSVSAIRATKRIDSSSIGNLFYNNKAYILDKEQRIVPYGAQGELYLSGYQLAKGYLNRDKETNSVFIKNPFDGDTQGYEMMYKTGDIVRYLPDGTLGFIGRADSQVKIRGNRVELGEVESCIREISEIQDITVQTITNNNNKELVAYVVADKHNKSDVNIKDLIKKHVSNTKPDYMIPAHVVVLDKIPLNINGKVDVRALPKPDITKSKTEYVAPTNEIERKICNAFSQVFNIEKIGIKDDFIALGGDSLSAIHLLSILKDYNFTVANILSSGTPQKLAKIYKTNEVNKLRNIKFSLDEGVALSNTQINVYLDQKINSKYNTYKIINVIKIEKQFSLSDIKIALDKLIDAYPILSTKVEDRSDGAYLVKGKHPLVNFITDYKKLDLDFKLDPNKGPLSVFNIVKHKNLYYLYYIIHHLIFDGKSVDILNNTFNKLLKDNVKLNKDYSFIRASEIDASIRDTDIQAKHIKAFDKIFNHVDSIAYIYPQETGYVSYINKNIDIDITLFQQFIKNNKITEAIFFEAVFGLVYSNFTYSNTPVFCITDNGRDLVDSNRSIGMYVKNIPIALSIKNTSIKDYIKHVFDIIMLARESSTLPFYEYKNRYNVDASVIFQYFSDYIQVLNSSNQLSQDKDIFNNSNKSIDAITDIDCYLYKHDNNFSIKISHSNKYDDRLVESLANTFELVVNEVLTKQNISEIDYADSQTLSLYDKHNQTETALRYRDILEAFLDNTHKHPNNICLVYSEKKYTYKQVDAITNGLAQKLKDKGVKKQDRIAIHVDISEYYLIASLAILKLNATYIPINTDYPLNYKQTLINESNTKLIITTKNTTFDIADIIQIKVDDIKPQESFKCSKYQPKDIACVIFTSGTTGTPKGAKITRIGCANLCDWQSTYINLSKKDVFGMYQNFSFVSHIDPLFSSIFVGATIDIIPNEVKQDIHKLNNYCITHNITAIKMGASIGRLFVEQIKNTTLRVIFLGGEKLGNIETNRKYQIIDGYGPTENTAQTTAIYLIDKSSIDSIGYPIFNNKVYVLNKFNKRLPLYATGKIYASGLGLSEGYINNNTQNKKVSTTNIYSDDKSYKTLYDIGDLVRYTSDASISYIGRADKQIQIRGNRVELGEVEACIREISEIQDVTVQTITNNNNKELVAYVLADKHDKSDVNIKDLIKKHVSNEKPDYMVPTHVVVLDKIPLNVNGKVDKQGLPKVDILQNKVTYIAPTNNVEKSICDAFAKVFNLDKIGMEDDFVALGGNSLIAIKIMSLLDNVKITAGDILTKRTPRQLYQIHKTSFLSKIYNYQYCKNYESNIYPLLDSSYMLYTAIKQVGKIAKRLYLFNMNFAFSIMNADSKILIRAIKDTLDAHLYLKAVLYNKDGKTYIKRRDYWYPSTKIIKLHKQPSVIFSSRQFKPFDIDKDDLFRIKIYEYKQIFYLYINWHHILGDGVSVQIFIKDLFLSLNRHCIKKEKFNAYDISLIQQKEIKSERGIKNKEYYDKLLKNREISDFPNKRFGSYISKFLMVAQIPQKYTTIKNIYLKSKVNSFCDNYKISVSSFFLGSFVYEFISTFNKKNLLIGGTSSKRDNKYVMDVVGCIFGGYVISYKHDSANSYIDTLKNIEISSLDTFSYDLSFYLSGKYMNSRKITYNFRAKDLYNDGLVLDNESDIKSKNSVDIKPLPFINKNIIPFPVYITVDKDKNGNYALTFNYQRVLYSKKMMNKFVANMDALIKNSLNES